MLIELKSAASFAKTVLCRLSDVLHGILTETSRANRIEGRKAAGICGDAELVQLISQDADKAAGNPPIIIHSRRRVHSSYAQDTPASPFAVRRCIAPIVLAGGGAVALPIC